VECYHIGIRYNIKREIVMSKLILAEKPSVARNIAAALGCKDRKDGYIQGNGYIITWAFGHLLQLYDCKDYD